MSDNKDNQSNNQDFIEGNDDFADSMDMNFADENVDADMGDMPSDDVINIEPESFDDEFDSIDNDGFEDEWAEDFEDDLTMGDDNLSNDDFNPGQMVNDKPERNWFNIGLFGILGVAVCFVLYVYITPMFSGDDGAQLAASQSQTAPSDTVDNTQNNEDLAQQAVAPELTQLQESGGLLANPDIFSDGVETVQRPDVEAEANAVFDALADVPEMAENEIDDIFAAIEDMQGTNAASEASKTSPQTLPAPSDEAPVMDLADITLDNQASVDDAPRAPVDDTSIANTGVASLNNTTQTDTQNAGADIPETPEQTNDAPVDMEQMQAINDRMDAIMDRLDGLAKQVDTVANSEPVLTPAAPQESKGADISALEQTIANLEKKVSDLSKQKSASAKAAPIPRKITTPRTAYKAPAKVAPTPKWELRGASPQEAYVAEVGTQNLRTVSVGDSLNGVGRIQSIGQENGRWVVRGTSGRIYQ